MIKPAFRGAIVVAVLLAASPAQAQDLLKTAEEVLGWFPRVNQHWQDKVVEPLVRQQLLRSSNRLRKRLFALHGDTQLLLESIPDAPPDAVERRELAGQIDTLQASVAAMRKEAEALAADMAAYDQSTVRLIRGAGIVRSATLKSVEADLRASITRPAEWRPAALRARLEKALLMLETAQASATKFRNRLAAQR